MVKKVKFSKNILVHTYQVPAKHNYIRGRNKSKRRNRKLRRIERYMRSHSLLLKDEYLDYSKHAARHIRGDYINFICRKQGFIDKNRYLIIVS